jgi:hypothetical protein
VEALRFVRHRGSHIFRYSVSLSALRAGRFLPTGKFLVLISVRDWVDPRAIVRLEGLSKLKKSTSSGTKTDDHPACSIVPQPTTLPRAPNMFMYLIYYWMMKPLGLRGKFTQRTWWKSRYREELHGRGSITGRNMRLLFFFFTEPRLHLGALPVDTRGKEIRSSGWPLTSN